MRERRVRGEIGGERIGRRGKGEEGEGRDRGGEDREEREGKGEEMERGQASTIESYHSTVQSTQQSAGTCKHISNC